MGEIIGVAVGKAATFALLLARFVGSVTHPVASMQAAMKSADAKYRFIPGTLLFPFLGGLIPQGLCRGARLSLRLRFFSAPLRETLTR